MDELRKREANPRSEPQVQVCVVHEMLRLTVCLRILRIGLRSGVVPTLEHTPTKTLLGLWYQPCLVRSILQHR